MNPFASSVPVLALSAGAAPAMVLLGLTGLCLGSFAVTAGIRAARDEQVLAGRSHCDRCGRSLSLLETLPILSYGLARGKCRTCRHRIDPLHPLGELAGAGVVISACLVAGPVTAILTAVIGLLLLASAASDLRSRRLPDRLTLAIAIVAAGLATARGGFAGLALGLGSAAVTFLIIEGVRRGYARLKHRAGLGFGDVKLLAALALWLGPTMPWVVVLASILGLLMLKVRRPADGRIPFGPAIAAAAVVVGLLLEAGWLSPVLGDVL